jgi:hypothetical protein
MDADGKRQRRLRLAICACCALFAPLAGVVSVWAQDGPSVEFNRDVRPILADACYRCHGPDANSRQAELRLDTQEGAVAKHDGRAAIVPGKLAESELWRRIASPNPEERMPPADSGKRLSGEQIATLRRWIERGAEWQRHWSFIAPSRPILPAASQADTVRNPIDALVQSRLQKERLAPSPEADRPALLRRVTLDLTGLPPTPGEVSAFLADHSPDAYERVVERLLASPRYGERMAARWLDAARYADTSGYQSDGERHMWRWRDWVVESLNANLSFDQFTIWQLAGDLLPDATLDQRLATGFNRNHRGNAEGGIIPEEYAVEYVVDRVETTSTVWLGLTMGCVRCHDHKFDPFTQREFYQLYAFFNNVPEKGRAIKLGNSPPYIKTPTRLQQEQLAQRERIFARLKQDWRQMAAEVDAAQPAWELSTDLRKWVDWQPAEDLAAAFALDGDLVDKRTGLAGKTQQGQAEFVEGQVGQAAEFDGRSVVDGGDLGGFGFFDKFTLAAWVWVPADGGGTIVSRMTDVPEGDGYQLALAGGKLQLNLVKRWLDDATRVETAEPMAGGKWHHVAATYDGSRLASGITLYVDGRPQELTVQLDELNQSFATKQPLRIGGGGGPAARFRGRLDEVRVYAYDLPPEQIRILATHNTIGEIISRPANERSNDQQLKLRACFLDQHAPHTIQSAHRELAAARRELRTFIESLPTTMVMEELATPRPAHVLVRGQYDKPGAQVVAGGPEQLLPWPKDAPANRLGLARWLVDPAHPLTSRVTVNRFWQMYFGTGLVKTVEDFGTQGEWPIHAELLDWLATEFIRRGWDVKAIQRTILTSGVYRQSSQVTPALRERDPENRLLARGPRQRLAVEMVRDQALAASGLLVEQIGGPSVKPPQPAGLWNELTGGDDYVAGQGADHYRRSLYTYWKRTIPPPSMAVFDAATREFCTVREVRTNTPLQALTLLNDPAYVEAARVLAERVMHAERPPVRRLQMAFLLVTGRQPAPRELAILSASLARHLARYEGAPAEASKLLAVGSQAADPNLRAVELAAYAAVCSTILNLDEAVTKE